MEKYRPRFFLIAPCINGGNHENVVFESMTPPPLGSIPQQGLLFTDPCPDCGRVFVAEINVTPNQQGWAAIDPVIRMVVP